jgi:hypothetical protein
MDTIYIIIDINIDKMNYLKKSLLSIFGKVIKQNNIVNIQNIQINDTNLFIIYSDNTLPSDNKLINLENDINAILFNTTKYIKNIYPEFGNDWYFSYKLTNNYLLEKIDDNNICIIL